MEDLQVWAVRLPDKQVHLARPGHTRAVCGAYRLSNADTVAAAPTCETCITLFRERTGGEPLLLQP